MTSHPKSIGLIARTQKNDPGFIELCLQRTSKEKKGSPDWTLKGKDFMWIKWRNWQRTWQRTWWLVNGCRSVTPKVKLQLSRYGHLLDGYAYIWVLLKFEQVPTICSLDMEGRLSQSLWKSPIKPKVAKGIGKGATFRSKTRASL